ncbi:PREDICTED: otefin [Bactrocera latifrons]|uniref:Otefin n=1 Tax=Bactrocera latifrons TaxID=174628 RepID=A0A0K8W109_BACLA|nr:PREDICTED: otefin [Bactrocera latifrons]
MSEIDNLESLSNADLRKQCIKHGLPNVPITDSSRNILIKKLRASLSGSPASQTKKTPRRETIHVVKTTEAAIETKEVKAEPERRTPSRGANRRTFAGTPTFDSQKPSENQPSENLTPAPIGTRRRSTRDQEIAPSQKEQKSTKTYNPVVILESDEEDQDLLLAAEQVEQRSKPSMAREEANVRSRSSRSVSLSKTGVVTTSLNQPTVQPIAEVPQIPIRREVTESISHEIYKPQISANSGRFSLHPNLMQPNIGVGLNKDRDVPKTLHSRYSTNTLSSGLYSSKPTYLYTEQSDDNEEAEGYETPFLSSFARNLERIKTDGVVLNKPSSIGGTDISREYVSPRPVQPSRRYEISGRRPTKVSVTDSFRQLLIALDRKYNLRLYLVLVTVFLIMAFIFVMVYQ